MKVKTVSEKINDLFKPGRDSDEDSEDGFEDGTTTRVVDFEPDEYDLPDAGSTEFRKRNVKLLSDQSARYKGKITSRKELQIEDSEASENELSSDEEQENADDVEEASEESNIEDDSYNQDDESSNEESDGDNEENQTEVISKQNRQAEIQKGICVQNQLHIFERLLEMRIKNQQILNKANKLDVLNESHKDFESNEAKEIVVNTCHLLKSLLELKSALTPQFPELRTHMKSLKKKSVLCSYDSGEPPLKRIASELENQHNEMRSYRNNVLLKWDDRTKLLTPGAGAKKRVHEEFDIIKKIDNALLNRDTLIEKSRVIQIGQTLKQSEAEEETNAENDENSESLKTKSNPNIYDDSDFYHQQLREFIEYKSNSSKNYAEVTKQYMELQKIREKMKKKVDTNASKGRKLRYTVHKKLVNFMAPDNSDEVDWPDESKDELFKSLFR